MASKAAPLLTGSPSPGCSSHGSADVSRRPSEIRRPGACSYEVLTAYMPIFNWLPRYHCREMLLKDVACGITLGCILIGQSLAHATLSKVSVIHGPYSCIVPPLAYAIFGTCNQASVGTGGLLALLTGTALERIGDLEERNHAAGVLCLLVGLMMALMGIFQLAFLVRFLSRPALSGFITGSALLIIKAMLMPMLGLPTNFVSEGLSALIAHPERLLACNPVTCALSLVSFLFLFFAKAILPKKLKDLKELIVLGLSAGFCFFYGQRYGVELVGDIPSGLPRLHVPIHSVHHLTLAKRLLPEAALIALVCFISSFASAKKCGMKDGYQVVAFNELLALGLANIGSAFSSGVPTQIGLSRSALAYDMGVKTPLGANIFVACAVAGVLQVFGPVLGFVPRCILNTIIVNAAYGLFEFGHARKLWSYTRIKKRKDLVIWTVAFLGTIILGAFEGILWAVLVSLVFALKQIVNPKMDLLGKREIVSAPDLTITTRWVNIKKYPDAKQTPGVLVIRLDGPLFYANCERFQDDVAELELDAASKGTPLGAIVLSAASIPFVDSTAIEVLAEMLTSFRERHVRFYIADAYGSTREFLTHALGKHLMNSDIQLSIDACVELYMGKKQGVQARLGRRLTHSANELPVVIDGP